VIGHDDFIGQFLAPVEFDMLLELVVENVGESLIEDQGQDEVFVLGGIGRATDHACGVPQPGLEFRNSEMIIGLQGKRQDGLIGGRAFLLMAAVSFTCHGLPPTVIYALSLHKRDNYTVSLSYDK